MPLEYAGGGVLKEHAAVREAVGIFDVSHLGKARVTGPGAAAFVNACLTNDLGRIEPGKAQYTLCCDDATGGVVDDIIAYLHGDDHVFLDPERGQHRRGGAPAGGGGAGRGRGHRRAPGLRGARGAGPALGRAAGRAGAATDHEYMSFEPAPPGRRRADGVPHRLHRRARLRTGRPGRPTPWRVWDALFGAGEPSGCGPAAWAPATRCAPRWATRCTARTCRWRSPRCRRASGWAVGWKKPAFWGRDALLAEKEAGPRRQLWGLVATDRGIPRPHMTVLRRRRRRSARSPAGRSRRRARSASRWRCSTPRPDCPKGTVSRSTCAAGARS